MIDLTKIREHMPVIGADGVQLGTVDRVEGDRIKLTRHDSGSHSDHHHFVAKGLIAAVDDGGVWLSASGANAALLEEEADGKPIADRNR